MKVLGINGSARKDGNTAMIIRAVFSELERHGIETELIQLTEKEIKPCRFCMGHSCMACQVRRPVYLRAMISARFMKKSSLLTA